MDVSVAIAKSLRLVPQDEVDVLDAEGDVNEAVEAEADVAAGDVVGVPTSIMVLISPTSPVILLKPNSDRWDRMDAGKSISAAGPIIIVIMTLVLEETRTSRMANVPFSS